MERDIAFECEWLVQQRLQKLCKILEGEMYENERGCNFCSSAVVDFVSQGGCHNTRFFIEVAFTEVHLTTILA